MYSVNRVTEFSEHQQIKLQNVYILFYQLKNIYDCIFLFFFFTLPRILFTFREIKRHAFKKKVCVDDIFLLQSDN